MNTIVIYHSADYDGLFCREIARKFLPDAELVGWNFGDPPVKPTRDYAQVIVTDLPCDKPLGLEADKLAGVTNLIWIDHHKSAIESHPRQLPGYRIDGVAACRLAWQWFSQPGSKEVPLDWQRETMPAKQDFLDRKFAEPLAVRLAGEYDIWDKRDERAELFQFGLRSRELTEADWNEMLDDPADGRVVPELLDAGRLLQRYQWRNDAGLMHRSFLVEFEGLKFLALTTARCNSLTFAARDVPATGHDALMGFYWNGAAWTVSLYHAQHRTELDLSLIAVKYGGGGHRGACGFTCPSLPFLPKGASA